MADKIHPAEDAILLPDHVSMINEFHKGKPVGESGQVEQLKDQFSWKKTFVNCWTGLPNCFRSDQLVKTSEGNKKIEDVKIGDKVLSFNHEKKVNEYREVLNTPTFKRDSIKMIKIKMKDGTEINCTEDHEFFYKGDYVKIKDLIKLL